jgi:hypothetical protein
VTAEGHVRRTRYAAARHFHAIDKRSAKEREEVERIERFALDRDDIGPLKLGAERFAR